jgi:2-methylisocitrate lyase-like PEP mutase family enzyme
MNPDQLTKAQTLLALHHQKSLFLLPNAWDAASARLYEEAGFPAVGTTSAGIAFSMGYPDGQVMPFEEMLYVVRRIAQSVRIPVTADLVAGFAHSDEELASNIHQLIETGAVGLNFEDGKADGTLAEVEHQAHRIRLIRQVANERHIPLVINARVDAYWVSGGKGSVEETVKRAQAYVAAGADCIFVPGMTDLAEIAQLRAQVSEPINLLSNQISPAQLAALGIDRLSLGGLPFRASLGYLQQAVAQAKEGNLSLLNQQPFAYATLMKWFSGV